MHQSNATRSGLPCFLFIYLVQVAPPRNVGLRPDNRDQKPALRYCTVLAFGRSLEAAERVAINRVHQQGLHIVRTDTATAAPWLDAAWDGVYLHELACCGSSLRISDTAGYPVPATAA